MLQAAELLAERMFPLAMDRGGGPPRRWRGWRRGGRLGNGGKPEAEGVNSNRADDGHTSGDTASGKGQEVSAPDGADGRAPDPRGCESRNGVEMFPLDDEDIETLNKLEKMSDMDSYMESGHRGCKSRNGVESSTADDLNEDDLDMIKYMNSIEKQ